MTRPDYKQATDTSTVRTDFERAVYTDATLAGLTPLIPIPLLDWWLEGRFARRIVERIAAHRGLALSPEVRRAFNAGGRSLFVEGLLFVLKLPLKLVLRLLGKLVYVLAIKEATESVSAYWQRAFLIDHMLLAGHLHDADSARRARQAMREAMRGIPSPLTALARQLAQRVWQLRPFRRRSSAEQLAGAAAEQRTIVERQWDEYEGFLLQLAGRYDQIYAEQRRDS